MALVAGTRLGSYEVVAPIGKGGMGEVYRARDTKLDRDVAIKVLPEEFANDGERLARFEREAKLLASLNHPNIATLYGLEESNGSQFLAMELVEGMTLAERIGEGPISIDEVLPLFKQIAEGLEAAHEKGVIHRDLKPANIKLTPDGKPKILDFGLAKALSGEEPSSNLSESPTVAKGTASGIILGTAPYMSPEQAKGKPVDRRTDIWALGCVLYEALTGQKVFEGETVSETLVAILKDEPRWDRLPVETPGEIRVLLRRCLRKDAFRRLHDAADVRIELEDALTEPRDSSSLAASAAAPARTSVVTYVTRLVAVVATAVAIWALLSAPSSVPRPVIRSTIPLASGERLFLSSAPTVALSGDGQKLAYVSTRGDTTQLYLRFMKELEAKPVGGTDGAFMPFFSPDGQWLGFAQAGKLMKVSVGGGAPVVLCDVGSSPRGASWSSDGSIVFVPNPNGGIQRVGEDGGEPQVLKVPDRERREKSYRFPEVLPGGKAVVFTMGTGDIEFWDDAAIALLSLETGEYRILLEGGSHPHYSPTGHLVYARAGSLFAAPFDLDELEVTAVPKPVLEGVITSPTKGPAPFSISRSGSLLYAPGDPWGIDLRVVSVDREGRSEPIVEARRAFYEVALSPDGKSLAISIDNANTELWTHDIARGTMTRLISGGFNNMSPVWTPDGERLAFGSNREGADNVFWQAADGSGEAERLSTSQFGPYPESWAPDGRTLAVGSFRPETGFDIWMLSLEGDRTLEPFLRTGANEEYAQFSPNGRWIAYESDESGQMEIYLRSFPDSGAKWQVSTKGGAYPVWSPVGRELFYRGGNNMMVVDIDPDEPRPLLGQPRLLFEREFVFSAYSEVFYDVMPDGQHFVMVDGSESAPPPTELILVQNWTEELKRLVPPDE